MNRLGRWDHEDDACSGAPCRRPARPGLRHATAAGRAALLAALLAAHPPRAVAQAPAGDAAEPGEEIEVVGLRGSLRSAQELKRTRVDVVDSVVATDVTKLPDVSVSDALSRVTGVQIARDRGEGGAVTIRSLAQIETTLDGREYFTAGTGRTLDLTDVPAELISRIDVYKTYSAERVEGGVGGQVDLRTRRPFDFPRAAAGASWRLVHGDLVDDTRPQLSFLASDRWGTAGGPELGVLAALSWQERAFRQDQKSAGNPTLRTDLVPGVRVTAPNGTSESASAGHRRRLGGSLVVQARPTPRTELHAEGAFTELRTRQDTQQMNVGASSAFEAGSARLFPGTSDLQAVTWTGAPITILSFARDTRDRTHQLAGGASWTGERVALSADASDTRSSNRLDFSGLTLAGTAARFSHDLSPRVASTAVSGTDLLDPASFRVAGVTYRVLPYDGELAAARADGDVTLGLGPLDKLALGVRAARRHAGNGTGLVYGDAAAPGGVPAGAVPGLLAPDPYSPFFPGSASIGPYLGGDAAVLRDNAGLRAALGIAAPVPSAGGAFGLWRVREDTLAAYALATFGAGPVAGTLGLRAVQTREDVEGNQGVAGAGVEPISVSSRYLDWLPTLNLRCALPAGLVVHAAASRTLTRPGFDQLSPSLTLVPNSANPALNQGSAGNPRLRPIRADNLDLTLEAYLGPSASVFATAFLKKVDGFVATSSAPEAHGVDANGDPVLYQVTRPYNTNRADVRGLEVGYQQFYAFLPGPLRGLGLQANYTLVSSDTRDPVLGGSVPLQNFSKHSANVVGLYELGGLSARVALNWRARFLSGASSFVNVGTLPIYTRAYGWLDASLGWRFGGVEVTLAGVNLLRTVRRSEYGTATRPQSAYLDDVQLLLTIAART